jgi:hypothetical protein
MLSIGYCLAVVYWLLAVGCCLLAIGYWMLSIGYWLLAGVYWLLDVGCCLSSWPTETGGRHEGIGPDLQIGTASPV